MDSVWFGIDTPMVIKRRRTTEEKTNFSVCLKTPPNEL
jgi:hypothetical protein